MTPWPSTKDTPPPSDHPYASALWLLGRHPRLVELVDRLPGVVVIDDGRVHLDLDLLADGLGMLDGTDRHRGEAAAVCNELGVMSTTEVLLLRLLGCWSPVAARLPLPQTSRLDQTGSAILADWTVAVLAH